MKKKNGLSLKGFIILLIIVFFISVLSGTYAYFAFSRTSDEDITGDAATVNLTLSVRRVLPIESRKIVPQLSGNPLQSAIRSGCVDSNDNGVCQVYEIEITNGSTSSVELDGNIGFRGSDLEEKTIQELIPNLKWMLVSSFDEEDIENTILGSDTIKDATSVKTNFVSNVLINANDSNIYYVVLWLNEIDDDQEGYSQSFFGDVTFVASNGMGVTATFS